MLLKILTALSEACIGTVLGIRLQNKICTKCLGMGQSGEKRILQPVPRLSAIEMS